MNNSTDSKTRSQATLPTPDADAQAHSDRLVAKIREEIGAHGGKITFAHFMELALYAPGLGYYSAGSRKFGEQGDFVTAPEISPLFSRCVARQCQQVLTDLAVGNILELGAGSGTMAVEILKELEHLKALPKAYFILEVSADLRQRQEQKLTEEVPHLMDRVQWLDKLPETGFCGIVLANEVLDAMPVHRFRITAAATSELYVGYDQTGFCWQTGPLSNEQLQEWINQLHDTLPTEYESEVNLAAEAWIHTIAQMMQKGLILIFDYGFPRHEFYHPQRDTGTLMCHYRHRAHPDPLILVGLQDITAHVDFTALAETAGIAGLHVSGFTSQAFFLLSTGLDEMVHHVHGGDSHDYWKVIQQVKKLTLPSEMGELFKVMALTRNYDEHLIGFSQMDHRGRLLYAD
jgi:SAM-dependent MidA family methyltransferase